MLKAASFVHRGSYLAATGCKAERPQGFAKPSIVLQGESLLFRNVSRDYYGLSKAELPPLLLMYKFESPFAPLPSSKTPVCAILSLSKPTPPQRCTHKEKRGEGDFRFSSSHSLPDTGAGASPAPPQSWGKGDGQRHVKGIN